MNETSSCRHDIEPFSEYEMKFENVCDDCIDKLMDMNAKLKFLFQNEALYQLNEPEFQKNQIDWMINQMDLEFKYSNFGELPGYLKNYVNTNLYSSTEEIENSVFIRFINTGLQLIDTIFVDANFSANTHLQPSVRNQSNNTFISINDNKTGVNLKIFREGEDTFNLSVEGGNGSSQLEELNLTKNSRLLYSQKIQDSGNFRISGLKLGEYTVNLKGKNLSGELKLYFKDK